LRFGQFRDKKSLDLHEKSLYQSYYEIFPQNILKSRTFKKCGTLIVKKCWTDFIFKELAGAFFLLAGGFSNVSLQQTCAYSTIKILLPAAIHIK